MEFITIVIVGHQKQLQLLKAAKDSGRLGHAYIFSGPAKIGKKTLALEWLSQILGTNLAEGNAYSDFLFVKPLTDAKTGKVAGEITVDQIRGVIAKLSLKPSMGLCKAVVIDEAQLMNGEAQNCLLKTLEEPPGDAVIVLIAQNSQRLLETIRSRCEIVQFGFVPEREMAIFAKDMVLENSSKLDEVKIKEIVKLSFGRPGRLVDFLADEAQTKKWQANAKEFAQIINAELPEKFAYAKKITDSENPEMNLNEIFEIWQFHFRNLMLEALHEPESAKAGPLRDESSQRPGLGETKPRFVFSKTKENPYTLEKIAAILKKIHDLNVILTTTNANPKLAVENFMLDI